MAHITEFSIDGLVGRKGIYTKKLNRDINIFYGLNGCGKTSLLKILHSALEQDMNILSNVSFKAAEVKIYSIKYEKEITYKIEKPQKNQKKINRQNELMLEEFQLDFKDIFLKKIELEKVGDFAWSQKNKQVSQVGRWAHRYLPTTRLITGGRSKMRTQEQGDFSSEENIDQLFEKMMNSLWAIYMSSVLSEVRTAQEEGLANILKGILTEHADQSKVSINDTSAVYERAKRFLKRQNAQAALGSLSSFEKRYSKNPQLKSVISYINEVESKIEDAYKPRDEFQNLIKKLFAGNKGVQFKDNQLDISSEDGEIINLAFLSSGEKHILRVLLECLYAESNSLIIDEPELSMHIDWQHCLVSSMQIINKNAQLIIATHSPEIMAEVDDSKIFKL